MLDVNDKIAVTSSKGNQEKWEADGIWYKKDQFGYEGLAEQVVSNYLSCSNILTDTPFTFVNYQTTSITINNIPRTACFSVNFLNEGESIITLSHLYKRHLGAPLGEVLKGISSDKKRIAYIAEETAKITGLDMFPQYLTLLFEIDGLFLNDDRHLNNIAIIEKDGSFGYCPIFDNGAALLSNTMCYPMDIMPKALIKTAVARPFNTTFNRQVNAARSLYGSILKVPAPDGEIISTCLDNALDFYPRRDRAIINDRITTTIKTRYNQMFLP